MANYVEQRTIAEDGPRSYGANEVITLQEASVRLHCSYSTILRLVKLGELEAFRVRSSWKTTVAACDKYIEQRLAEQRIVSQSVEVAD